MVNTLGYNGDREDWYALDLSESGIFTFSISNLLPSGTVNGQLKNLLLYDDELDLIKSLNNSTTTTLGPGRKLASGKLALSKGYYFIKAIPYDFYRNAAPYRIETDLAPSNPKDLGEDNNTRVEATPLNIDEDPFEASIGYEDDFQDWYKIEIPKKGLFRMTLENLHPSWIELGNLYGFTIYDESLNQLSFIRDINAGKSKQNSDLQVEAGDILYAKVQVYKHHSVPYEISLKVIED